MLRARYDIDKYEDEIIGLSFENDMIKLRHCCNKCLFCFVDQLPPNMRSTMYVKDDDWRMSFIMGNYVTLTNLRKGELERIIRSLIIGKVFLRDLYGNLIKIQKNILCIYLLRNNQI